MGSSSSSSHSGTKYKLKCPEEHNNRNSLYSYICVTLTGFDEKVYDHEVTIGDRSCYDSDDTDPDCGDTDSNCDDWRRRGFCTDSHKVIMQESCRRSCGFCGSKPAECYDRDDSCQGFAENGNCGKKMFQDYVKTYCRKSCNLC